eukprot:gene15075-17275_t
MDSPAKLGSPKAKNHVLKRAGTDEDKEKVIPKLGSPAAKSSASHSHLPVADEDSEQNASGGSPTHKGAPSQKIQHTRSQSPNSKSQRAIYLTSSSTRDVDTPPPQLKDIFKTKIVGDIFGTSTNGLDGMMYRSRVMAKNEQQKKAAKVDDVTELDKAESIVSTVDFNQSESESEDEFKQFKTMNPKQQLALTMKNWTMSEDNDEHIISEGGVQALIALCHVEDAAIRKCCAHSFYNLSNRVKNREKLLNSGATNGVVLCLHGSPPRCTWSVAKLCALTLCNLSMQVDGEATMATENAVGALVQLSTYRGPALLPICVQALYNMTSAAEHFKGIERIIKAFLNVSSTGIDHSVFLVRALVNCSRYSWLRLRIIEDGALSCLHTLLTSLSAMDHKRALAYDILTALRSLSDSVGCRVDLISKGSIEILNTLLGYTDERGKLLTIKIIHNFMSASSTMTKAMFEMTVVMTTQIVNLSKKEVTLQYCSACLHMFTKEEIRGMKHLALNIIDSMRILLTCSDPLTQFFAISSSGNLFFNNLCNNAVKVEQLVLAFVQHGPNISDPAANQALALALAKLSQEASYMAVIEKLGLLRSVLELLLKLLDLHKNSLLLQESCCIAVCRIALRIDSLSVPEKERIAGVFFNMLETDDQYVLGSTISGIRALGSSGLCPKQLLSETLLSRIASIVARYNKYLELCRTGCAVLAVFSYDIEAHEMLAAENIMRVLFDNIKAEDGVTRELVATSLCNVSVNSTASNVMIKMGVVEVLATLSSSTSETILELCAKCICNLTCNVLLHPKMMENKVLEIILMISLVRTVSDNTKLICAKALLNLVTDDNLHAMEHSGAVRVFATLSMRPVPVLQQICSKGFYLLTLNVHRRTTLVSSVPVLQALFNMVKCQSSRTRIRIGTAVCNLLSCPATNKAAISAGALSVVKIIATMDFEELREATARVIINLAQDESLQDLMLRQPIVEILVLILQQSSNYTFECAIMAFSCLSQTKQFKKTLVSRGGISALIGTIITGKVCTPLVAEEVCRCLCHLSYNSDNAESMVRNGHLILSMQAIYLSGLCSADTALLITLAMRNLSESLPARKYLIDQGAFKLLVSIITDFTFSRYCCTIMYSAMVTFVYNLALVPALHASLVEQGLMSLLERICLYGSESLPSIDANLPKLDKLSITNEGENELEGGESVDISVAHEEDFTSALLKFKSSDTTEMGHPLQAVSLPNTPAHRAMPGVPSTRASLLFLKDTRTSIIQRAEDTSFEVLLNFTHNEVNYISKTINLLSQSQTCPEAIVQGGVMRIFKALIDGLSEGARSEVAAALASLAACKPCREELVKQGAGELLIALSITSDPITQAKCALALGYLSELTKVNNGVVASLLLLSLNLEENALSSPEKRVAASSQPSVLSAANNSVAEVVEVPPKTLTTLLRDVMVDKTKFDQYFAQLQQNNDTNLGNNDFVPKRKLVTDSPDASPAAVVRVQAASKLNVNETHRDAILAEETAMLRCDFQHYRLDTSQTSDTYESESGGMSVNVLMELPLPGIPANRDLEPLNRHDELTKSKISNDPLPKDCRVPFHVDSRSSQPEPPRHEISEDEKKDDDSMGFGDEDSENSDEALASFAKQSARYGLVGKTSPGASSGSPVGARPRLGSAGKSASKKIITASGKRVFTKSGSFESGDPRSADIIASMPGAGGFSSKASEKLSATPKSSKFKRINTGGVLSQS